MMPPEIVGEKMEPERLCDSVNVLLSLQVRINFHQCCIESLSTYLFCTCRHAEEIRAAFDCSVNLKLSKLICDSYPNA